MLQVLSNAATDPLIRFVLVVSVCPRAFCAGGDIKGLVNADESIVANFFSVEYQLDYLISIFPKPFISLLNALTMGGGAGISMHGKFRVAGEKFMFAMPEVLFRLCLCGFHSLCLCLCCVSTFHTILSLASSCPCFLFPGCYRSLSGCRRFIFLRTSLSRHHWALFGHDWTQNQCPGRSISQPHQSSRV